jgi:hypothetical protein
MEINNYFLGSAEGDTTEAVRAVGEDGGGKLNLSITHGAEP